ncbi:hypothetical protein C7271_17560 [filamentous cyanobacterium CCP5]|nr:hypothetical protein C7271_17560 [filamentous cyanobacterium CCP5]
MAEPVSIFFSYCRKDELLMQELKRHLGFLQRKRWIESWDDSQIKPGEEWDSAIKANLANAQIILLLISVDFIESDYCYAVELAEAIDRHQAGSALVIPVILRACLWGEVEVGGMELGTLQALPKDAKPIVSWPSKDDAFTSIATGVNQEIKRLRQEQEQAKYAGRLREYEQEFASRVAAAYPLSQAALHELSNLQQQLKLKSEDVARIEQPIIETAEATYQQALAEAERQRQAEAVELKRKQAETQRRQNTEKIFEDFFQQEQEYEYLGQDSDDQEITDFEQAQQYDHPQAEQRLAEAKQKQEAEDDLRSEKGIDYSRLRDLLKAGQWKEADQETADQMLKAMGKDKWWNVEAQDLLSFPCADLLTIDGLWVKFSQGRFGLSVQKEIYVQCGAKLDGKYPGNEIWYKFCGSIGWSVGVSYISYPAGTFNTSAQPGHLPLMGGVVWGYLGGRKFPALFSRIETCRV